SDLASENILLEIEAVAVLEWELQADGAVGFTGITSACAFVATNPTDESIISSLSASKNRLNAWPPGKAGLRRPWRLAGIGSRAGDSSGGTGWRRVDSASRVQDQAIACWWGRGR